MFSVVIPLYNKSLYIEKTIDSVLEQTFQKFELIVIDDGSTDSSLSKVKLIKENLNNKKHQIYIDFKIIEQNNQGVSIARNTGINAAKYDYIAFLDADDWWHQDFLVNMNLLIKKYPDAGIYGSQYYWIKNGKQRISQNGLSDGYIGYINYFKAYLHAWYMPLTSISVVVKKSVLKSLNGFNSNLKFGEDFDLWTRISLNYKIAYINKGLAYYNQNVEMKNRALGENKIYAKEAHYIFNLDYLNESEKQNHLLKKLLDGLRVRALIRYHLAKKYKDETKRILNKVDFTKQPKYFQRIYKWPIIVIKLYLLVKKGGSFFKQNLIKISN